MKKEHDVYNLYEQIQGNFDALFEAVRMLPYHDGILKRTPMDKVEQAAIFLARSNFYMLDAKKEIKKRLKMFYLWGLNNEISVKEGVTRMKKVFQLD